MNRPAEDARDIETVEAWAIVIESVLSLVPADQRADVLAIASKNEEAASKDARLMAV